MQAPAAKVGVTTSRLSDRRARPDEGAAWGMMCPADRQAPCPGDRAERRGGGSSFWRFNQRSSLSARYRNVASHIPDVIASWSPEVLPAELTPIICPVDAYALPFMHPADHRPMRGKPGIARKGRGQRVILATRKRPLQGVMAQRPRHGGQRGGELQSCGLDIDEHPARRGDVAEVGEQAVTDV